LIVLVDWSKREEAKRKEEWEAEGKKKEVRMSSHPGDATAQSLFMQVNPPVSGSRNERTNKPMVDQLFALSLPKQARPQVCCDNDTVCLSDDPSLLSFLA